MPNTKPSIANLWATLEAQTDGTCELVLSAIGATERRIPFDTTYLALAARATEVLRYMDDLDRERQARA